MKTIRTQFLIWAALLTSIAFAEELTVFSLASKSYKVSPYAVGMNPTEECDEARIRSYQISKKLGVIDSGDTMFAATVKLAYGV